MMKRLCLLPLLIFLITSQPIQAQNEPTQNNFKQQFLRHFDYASRVVSLAKAIPAEKYSWKPDEEVYSVANVFTHIARYNFLYPETSLGIPAPEGVDVENMESLTEKEEIVSVLEQSFAHVNSSIEQMPASKLSEETKLYGSTVNGQAVLMQLITHLSEHVGQAIAYARTNGIVPPWSR